MGLLSRIEELEKELAELKCKVKEGPKFPEYGDTYWYIGKIGTGCWGVWEDSSVDKHLKSIGNVFETGGEAEFAVEKLKVEAELRKFSRPFENREINYYMVFDMESDNLTNYFTRYCPPQGAIYFESEQKAKQAIETVGEERIKKYIFGII